MGFEGTDARFIRRAIRGAGWLFEHPYKSTIRTCFDFGAHVGLFSLTFRIIHPRSTIIAVEPDPSTYKMLCNNLAGFNIVTKQEAFGNGQNAKSLIQRKRSVARPWDNAEGGDVPSRTLRTWLLEHNRRGDVFVKMDVEGAEHHLFESDDEIDCFVEKVSAFHIEVHRNWDSAMRFIDRIAPRFELTYTPNPTEKMISWMVRGFRKQ